MNRLQTKKMRIAVLRRFFQLVIGAAMVYTFLLAGASDSNSISGQTLFAQVIGCGVLMLGAMYAADHCQHMMTSLDRRIARRRKYTAAHNLYAMDFGALCDHFTRSGCETADTIRTGRVLGEFEWTGGSLNDHLRRWVVKNGIPYVSTATGKVWFSENGKRWHTAELQHKHNSRYTIYECIPVLDGIVSKQISA